MKNRIKLVLLLFVISIVGISCASQTGARDVYAGVADVFILRQDKTLWGAGYNYPDQLGGDIRIARINDEKGNPFQAVQSVAVGESHTVILKDDGTIWGAGDSRFGELGQNGGRFEVFTQLKTGSDPISGVKAVTAGNNSTFVVAGDGSLLTSGFNYSVNWVWETGISNPLLPKLKAPGKR